MILLTIYCTGVLLNILFFTVAGFEPDCDDPLEDTVDVARISFLWPIFWLGFIVVRVKQLIGE